MFQGVRKDISVPRFREIYTYIFLILLVYIFLFQPPVISKYIYIVLEFLFLVVYVILPRKHIITLPINKFKNEFIIIAIVIIYAGVRDSVSGEVVYFDRFAAWFFQSFIFSIFIITFIEKYNHKMGNMHIITLLYWATFTAAIFTALLLMNSSFDNYYQSIEILDDTKRYENYEFRYRVYGISENLTFTYSYVLGFFAGYTILVITNNILLIIPFFLFVLGVIFNARIGFVAIFIFFLISLRKKYVSNLLVLAGLSTFLIYFIVMQIPSLWERVLSNKLWVLQAFYDVAYAVTGIDNLKPEASTIKVLTESMIILPETLSQWIFGRGISLFGLGRGVGSDIGYVLQLNYAGLPFLSIIIIMMIYFSYRLYKVLGFKHWYFPFFVISIFILNIKGFIFAATPGARLLFFLYCYFIITSDNIKKYHKT